MPYGEQTHVGRRNVLDGGAHGRHLKNATLISVVVAKQPVTTITTHTHTHLFNGLFSRTTWLSRYQKVKPIWILLKQETVGGSGISWAICKSAPCSRQITTPLFFLQAGCPSCRPTNSVKALKAAAFYNLFNLLCVWFILLPIASFVAEH